MLQIPIHGHLFAYNMRHHSLFPTLTDDLHTNPQAAESGFVEINFNSALVFSLGAIRIQKGVGIIA